jgi:hypothetical protein
MISDDIQQKTEVLKGMIVHNSALAGKIDLYVKRLQRYYNETGIRLNILKEFDIKI